MKPYLWQVTLAGITLIALIQAVPCGLTNPSHSSQVAPQRHSASTMMRVATGGANLRVRNVPNGDQFVTCLEDKTSIAITHYSSDRQWAFVASQQTAPDRWVPVNGWVRMQYLAGAHS